jgi:hypothetical protein
MSLTLDEVVHDLHSILCDTTTRVNLLLNWKRKSVIETQQCPSRQSNH